MTLSRTVSLLSAPDHLLAHRVHCWRPPRWIRRWMLLATRAGDGWLWYTCGLALLFSPSAYKYRAFSAAAMSVLTGILLFRILKKAVGRKRPCTLEPVAWADLLPPDQFSFPSGHTITAFSVAIPVGLYYPPLLPLLLFCAFSIAISRILLGMHYLSDVIAGVLIGSTLGYVFANIAW